MASSNVGIVLSCPVCGWNSTQAGSMSESPSGACEAFLKSLPSPSEAQYLFSAILNLQKPRGLKFNPVFRARAASNGALLAAEIVLGCLALAVAIRLQSAFAALYLTVPITLALVTLLPL
jgi:hypothetical protein